MEANGGFYRGSCLLLYGACFFGRVLDLSTTRNGLQLGAYEQNVASRFLFAQVGFNVAAAVNFAVFASFVVFSELLFWRLRKPDVKGILRVSAKTVLLTVWACLLISICFTVAGNLAVLQQLGNPHLFIV